MENIELIYKHLRSDLIRTFYFGDPNWSQKEFCESVLNCNQLPEIYHQKAKQVLKHTIK